MDKSTGEVAETLGMGTGTLGYAPKTANQGQVPTTGRVPPGKNLGPPVLNQEKVGNE